MKKHLTTLLLALMLTAVAAAQGGKNQECTTIVSTLHSFFDNDTKRSLRAFLQ